MPARLLYSTTLTAVGGKFLQVGCLSYHSPGCPLVASQTSELRGGSEEARQPRSTRRGEGLAWGRTATHPLLSLRSGSLRTCLVSV